MSKRRRKLDFLDLKVHLYSRGMKIKSLVEGAGISANRLPKLMNGLLDVREPELRAIEAFLGVDKWFFGGRLR